MFLFSIIIPTYNRPEKLQQTLENLCKQEFKNFEVVIVEDGTNNNEVIKIFSEKLNIKYIFQPLKKNVTIKRNVGAFNAIGKYLIFLDDDDFVTTQWLLGFSHALQNNIDIACCGVAYNNSTSTKILLPENPYKDERGWGIFLSGTFAVKKSIFDAVGGYDEILRYGENTELSIRLKQKIETKAFVNKSNLIYNTSVNGGSKNIENAFIANNHIITKHKEWFLQHPKLYFNYLSVLGVVSYKMKKIKLSKQYFTEALEIKKYDAKGLFRLIIVQFPFIASKVWKN